MIAVELQNNVDALQEQSAVDALTKTIEEKDDTYKAEVGAKIATDTTITNIQWEKNEKLQSNELLKNFKYANLIKNQIIQEALKFPEDSEQVKKIQLEIGYKEGSKNYYPEEHRADMKNGPDGITGTYTIEALNNMIADKLTSDEVEQLSKDSENKTDKIKSEQANKILDIYIKKRWY